MHNIYLSALVILFLVTGCIPDENVKQQQNEDTADTADTADTGDTQDLGGNPNPPP